MKRPLETQVPRIKLTPDKPEYLPVTRSTEVVETACSEDADEDQELFESSEDVDPEKLRDPTDPSDSNDSEEALSPCGLETIEADDDGAIGGEPPVTKGSELTEFGKR